MHWRYVFSKEIGLKAVIYFYQQRQDKQHNQAKPWLRE
jgi:hypothetical protein